MTSPSVWYLILPSVNPNTNGRPLPTHPEAVAATLEEVQFERDARRLTFVEKAGPSTATNWKVGRDGANYGRAVAGVIDHETIDRADEIRPRIFGL